MVILRSSLLVLMFVFALFSLRVDAEGVANEQMYETLPAVFDVRVDKVWTIEFSQKVDENSLNHGDIYVLNEQGERLSLIATDVSDDRLKVFVQNDELYQYNETYTLYVTADIYGVDGSQLLSPVSMAFSTIEQTPAIQTSELAVAGIEIGDEKNRIVNDFGEPERVTTNEYGVEWYTYHNDYQQFLNVGFSNQEVVMLYTNSDLIDSKSDIALGVPRSTIKEVYGEPVSYLQKGNVRYKQANDEGQLIYLIEGSYVTFFFDVHEDRELTALQVVREDVEQFKPGFYAGASAELARAFEWQLFDLVNAIRVRKGLNALEWDAPLANTARKHSQDMADNDYFAHENQRGEQFYDRINNDGIEYVTAGENLAVRQFSSIYAHEGLMNSWGHRENIVNERFTHLGVGVAFNQEHHPYFTQNYRRP